VRAGEMVRRPEPEPTTVRITDAQICIDILAEPGLAYDWILRGDFPNERNGRRENCGRGEGGK